MPWTSLLHAFQFMLTPTQFRIKPRCNECLYCVHESSWRWCLDPQIKEIGWEIEKFYWILHDRPMSTLILATCDIIYMPFYIHDKNRLHFSPCAIFTLHKQRRQILKGVSWVNNTLTKITGVSRACRMRVQIIYFPSWHMNII